MNVLPLFKPVRLIAIDVDGVLTDGTLWLTADMHAMRAMNIKDGYAIQLAVKSGYHVIIISGAADNGTVTNRMKNLGVTDVHMSVKDKAGLLQEKIMSLGLTKEQVLYIGDDIPDLKAMQQAGVPCCPSDAAQEIKNIAIYISAEAGGKGCVRDIIEKILKLNNHWETSADISSL
jgi:3-deoxy-D-manno-octulosonate 8-phosphate phosphatase (KDO 8-P phosphatase)